MKKMEILFQSVKGHSFIVKYWDGSKVVYGSKDDAEFTIILHSEPALHEMAVDPTVYLGEAYMDGEIEIDGSFDAVAAVLCQILTASHASLPGKILWKAGGILGAVQGASRQRENIHAHYDIGNEFFSLWLDKTMSYSCAYFKQEDDSLEQAQLQKLDLILGKLRLRPGMRLLDIGCGWGWLAVKAAKEYGCNVLGITLSEEQFTKGRERIEREGLEGRVEIRLQNYLDLEEEESFDRVVSVGMFEHVGERFIGNYFEKVHDLLKPGGVSLLHTITKLVREEPNSWLKKYIFPGGYIPCITEITNNLSERNMPLMHVESLRRHYAKTLDIWYENFMRPEVLEKVRDMFDERFVRMWSLYLCMAAAFFRIGDLDLHQFVFTRGVNNDLPMTFEDIYCS